MKKDKPKIFISKPPVRKFVRKANAYCTTSFIDGKQVQKWEVPALGEKPFDGRTAMEGFH